MIRVTKTASFPRIEKQWDELVGRNPELSGYQSAAYMRTLWDNLFPYRLILRSSPEFFLFEKEGEPCLILPFYRRWGSRRRVLYGFKSGVGYLNGAYGADLTAEELSECMEALKKELGGSTLQFEHVRRDTLLGEWLLTHGGRVSEEGCTQIPLPESYEEYYHSLSKHMKQNLRTAYNRLGTDGGVYEFRSQAYAGMDRALSGQLQKLYLERQRSRYGKSRLYPLFVRYVDLGTKIQRSDELRVKACILTINGRLAAYFDAIWAADTVIIPRLAIAEGFERYSPGVMLLNESIRELIGEGVRTLDLTHGTEPYKLSMGGVVRECVEAELRQ